MCALTTLPPTCVCAWAAGYICTYVHMGTYVVYENKPQSSSYFPHFMMFLNNLNETALSTLFTICKTGQRSGGIPLRKTQMPPGHGPG